LSVKLRGLPAEQAPIYAITASGKDKNVDTDDDFLLVDGSGKAVEQTHLKPSAETLIHCELYRLTGCGAIFHVHTVFNNIVSELYAARGTVPIEDIELIKAFNIWDEGAAIEVPIVPNYADIPKIAVLVESAIQPRVPGLLIRKHGICAWGDDAFAARRHLEAFEFLFEYVYRWQLLQEKN
jgi:methylthioribulose-1-phosphate dehydratase